MIRTAFQCRCDAAWSANWGIDHAVSVAVRDREDALAKGSRTNLYLIRDTVSDAVKIGIAATPDERLASLQIGNAHELELVDWVPGTVSLERFLHGVLIAHRLRGEWFAPATEVLVVCEMLMAAGDMRRDLERDGEQPHVDDTIGTLTTSADNFDDWLQRYPLQLTLDTRSTKSPAVTGADPSPDKERDQSGA